MMERCGPGTVTILPAASDSSMQAASSGSTETRTGARPPLPPLKPPSRPKPRSPKAQGI